MKQILKPEMTIEGREELLAYGRLLHSRAVMDALCKAIGSLHRIPGKEEQHSQSVLRVELTKKVNI